VEAKKDDLKQGMGQCLSSMVAAQRFNQQQGRSVPSIYGSVSTGTVWRFLRLEELVVTVDFTDYAIPPVDLVLSLLVWMAGAGLD
jgi:hypothetical protein